MVCRAHNHDELNKNKCILSVVIISHWGYSRMSHSIYFQVFFWRAFWVDVPCLNIPEGDLSTRECMQSQPLLKWTPCGFSPMSLLQSTKCMPDIFPFSPKELAVRMKTELAALHRLAAVFQMFKAPGLGRSCHLPWCTYIFPSLINYLQSRCNFRAKVSE